jgi:hypothetical protein
VSVKEGFVVCDATTQKPCGFGFLSLFSTGDLAFIMSKRHCLKGVRLDCKIALDRNQAKEKEIEELKRKVFVGGLPREASDQCLLNYFSQFG